MSLKGDKYETQDEIRFRLEGTVVLYDGKPVYISRVGEVDFGDPKEIARVFFKELPLKARGPDVRKYLSSRKFDLSPFRMGYMNINGEAIFVSRNPIRQNQQGLCSKNTVLTDCRNKRPDDIRWDTMIASQGFVDMFNNVYPDFKEVGELLGDKERSSVAVSKSFAFIIDHDLEALLLIHKGVKCGIALKEDKALKIPAKFHFLKEEMEEHRIPVA